MTAGVLLRKLMCPEQLVQPAVLVMERYPETVYIS